MTSYSHNIDQMLKYMTDDPIYTIQEHNIDLKANHIYLLGEESMADGSGEPGVEFAMANRFIKNLNILMRKSHDPILIHMKTCGGVWEEGMAIYDMIKACPNLVTILNYTHARSMSSLIFQAADKRVMMPHSKFMFHEGSMSYDGTTKQYMTEAEQVKLSSHQMLKIYIDSMKSNGKLKKKSRAKIEEWLVEQMNKKEEVYLSAAQAVKFGFADEVFGANGKYDWSKLTEFSSGE